MMRIQVVLLTVLLTFTMAAPAGAEVVWDVINTLALKGKPLATAVSDDNRRLFVLVEGGKVLVYSPGGALQETIVLEKPADSIALSKSGDILYLSSTERKAVDIVRLEFVQQISGEGSPAKGPESAPVAIAVFSDFQ